MGFRQFMLRGLERVEGECNLVTMSWNIKRMFALSPGSDFRCRVVASYVIRKQTYEPMSRHGQPAG